MRGAQCISMTNFKISRLALVAVLGASLAGACSSDDDDDDDNNNRGGSAGTAQHGGAGGEPGLVGPGGADPGQAGMTASGGTAGMAGAQQGGADGLGGEAALGGGGGAGGEGPLAALSDAQILLVLDTLNQGEVEEAYAALPRLSSEDVAEFAQQMVTDHSDARQSVLATAESLEQAPAPSELQAKLKGDSEARVALLRAASAANLDATYIEQQVAVHADALKLLNDLTAAADAEELEALLATLEAAVQQHYEHAQELAAEL